MSEDVNSHQVGGDHYRASYQHWDWIEETGLGYLEGCASKYILRWRKKEKPELDLEKSIHYFDKLISLFWSPSVVRRNRVTNKIALILTESFCHANGLPSTEREVMFCLATWQTDGDLARARSLVVSMLEKYRVESLGHQDA